MRVYGKPNIKIDTFKDLEKGEVFYFLSDSDKDNKRVYMRCGHTSELCAVNLETGTCHNFNGNETIKVMDGSFNISEII